MSVKAALARLTALEQAELQAEFLYREWVHYRELTRAAQREVERLRAAVAREEQRLLREAKRHWGAGVRRRKEQNGPEER